MISIQPQAKDVMIKDAVGSFPDECCGFFYGTEDSEGNRIITAVLVVSNAKEGDKRKRFEVSAKDYLKAEQYADEHSLQLLGVYHSHPNHPAIPSEHDRLAAQPYFSYIIISVNEEQIDDIRSWRLNDQFKFEEESLSSAKELFGYAGDKLFGSDQDSFGSAQDPFDHAQDSHISITNSQTPHDTIQ